MGTEYEFFGGTIQLHIIHTYSPDGYEMYTTREHQGLILDCIYCLLGHLLKFLMDSLSIVKWDCTMGL